MLIVSNVSLPLEFDDARLTNEVSRILKIKENSIKTVKIYRKSVDARRKNDVHFCCSVLVDTLVNEKKIIARCKNAQIFKDEKFVFPTTDKSPALRPVVVGFGPAGIFAALTLAKAGLKPLVIERGQDVDERIKAVDNFMSGGSLNTESNVQFGEGGAGTFSDGKLNTGIKNIRCRAVLEEFVSCGAQETILIDAKPHIGTDRLVCIIKNLRNKIIELGGEVRFSCCLKEIKTDSGKLCGIVVSSNKEPLYIPCEHLILAIGHSSRDTFEHLKDIGISMERKPFSVGARIEHLRKDIDSALYGKFAGHSSLGAADYKLAVHLGNGKGVYTFCMCPGGNVINASSETGATAINGMSLSARDGVNSNSAVLVDIKPDELCGNDVLEGMYLQRGIEQKAFKTGGGLVPIQTVGSLIRNKKNSLGRVLPTVKPGTIFCSMYEVLPKDIVDSITEGLQIFGKKIDGFDCDDAVLSFPETRSSSPVRITRREDGCSANLFGLYPCGEGAGYAGGIMSAAVDGIKTAEALINNL